MMGSCVSSQYSSEFNRPTHKLILNYLSGQKCLLVNLEQNV